MALPWLLVPPIPPSPELEAAVGGHPLVSRVLAQRGFVTPEQALPFLDPQRYSPSPPSALVGIDTAAAHLLRALEIGSNILVWGDFDVDGQTSTALLVTALQQLAGRDRVRFHVPNRFEEGHGIRVEKLSEILAGSDIPLHVLLTCDTGIAEGPAVGFAKDRGLTVVITDHHDLTAEFTDLVPGVDPLWGQAPEHVGPASVRRADAIVNPKLMPPGDPLRTLPGVGVAYKLAQRLFELAGRAGQENELLDLVALGIVADVAEQVHDARYLLQRGLEQLRTTRRAGLLALMNAARITPASLSADSIGFQLGPRMNALGRLEDATIAVELLTTRDALRAGQLAAKLERLNQERRLLTNQTHRAASEMLEREPGLLEHEALVLAHPNWHAGVVGIVASKLVEEFRKPTVLLLTPPGQPARGSARSVAGVDIGAAIAACSRLLLSHGGHPGAAGVSLLPENIAAFRRELSRQIPRHRDETVRVGVTIDAELSLAELSLDLAGELARLAPFGQGNPTPQFVSYDLTILGDRRMGREGTHRKLSVRSRDDPGPAYDVVWFNGADVELPAGPVDLVYSVGINEFQGRRALQLMYVASRLATPNIVTVAAGTPPPIQLRVHDLRRVAVDPHQLPPPAAAAWYAEGAQLTGDDGLVAYAPRTALSATQAEHKTPRPLVIWSAPPSPGLLRWLLETTQPSELYWVAHTTADDTVPGMLRHVGGMIKFALRHDGRMPLGQAAARVGVTDALVRHALLWFAAKGEISVLDWLPGDVALIAPGEQAGERAADPAAEADHLAEVEAHLAEIRAFRRFVQRATLPELDIQAAP